MTIPLADPFTLARDLLLRPAHAGQRLEHGDSWSAVAMTSLWVTVMLAFMILVLPQLFPVGTQGVGLGLGLSFGFVLLVIGVGVASANPRRSGKSNMIVVLRPLLATWPPLALVGTALFSAHPLSTAPFAQMGLLLLFLLLVGGAIGSLLCLRLVLDPRATEAAAARAVLGSAALGLGTASFWLAWSPPPWPGLVGVVIIGIAFGLLRPLSWLWEMLLSLALAALARAGVSPWVLLTWHPVNYDEQCLLPLPGLTSLLYRACNVDIERGGAWLVAVAEHPSQARAAYMLLRRVAHAGQLAHPLLFWLSTAERGVAVLERACDLPRATVPLLHVYADFAQTTQPEAWASVLVRHRSLLVEHQGEVGGASLRSLLETASGILRAERWPVAVAAVQSLPRGPLGDDDLWVMLRVVQLWVGAVEPEETSERVSLLQALTQEVGELTGWPGALLATVSEHLLFLLHIEQQKGAWLS
ncbi:MAG: hypothetical protein H0X37_06510 [Herpetosiphonaceae bacterium]|nr:hypothetical protein [Herpetosiphonaceae bacterium]